MDRISFELNIGLRASERFAADVENLDYMTAVRAVVATANRCRTLSNSRTLATFVVEAGAATPHGETIPETTAVVYATDFTPHDARLFLASCRELATSLRQDHIAVRIRKNGSLFGGLLIGEYAHLWNFGVFDAQYFISYNDASDIGTQQNYYVY